MPFNLLIHGIQIRFNLDQVSLGLLMIRLGRLEVVLLIGLLPRCKLVHLQHSKVGPLKIPIKVTELLTLLRCLQKRKSYKLAYKQIKRQARWTTKEVIVKLSTPKLWAWTAATTFTLSTSMSYFSYIPSEACTPDCRPPRDGQKK